MDENTELEIILSPKFKNRFWSNVKKLSECWEWTGSCNKRNGYGQVRVGDKTTGKIRRTHRVAYMISFGVIPKEIIRHKCNNAKCCNPEHLELGSHTQNMDDMFKALRHATQRQEKEKQVKEAIKQLTLVEKQILFNALYNELN